MKTNSSPNEDTLLITENLSVFEFHQVFTAPISLASLLLPFFPPHIFSSSLFSLPTIPSARLSPKHFRIHSYLPPPPHLPIYTQSTFIVMACGFQLTSDLSYDFSCSFSRSLSREATSERSESLSSESVSTADEGRGEERRGEIRGGEEGRGRESERE